MSLMSAKKARPVEDASALVPFGWAPGGYHCAACSTCGEAHAGSDKRSMRCQDCAEALRDKQPDEPAPTTRETADHAELARLADDPAMDFGGFGRGRVKTLLSEIAALRGEVERSLPSISFDGEHAISDHRRWLARQLLDSKLDDGEAYGIVAYHPAITDLRTTQAERQRDELREALVQADLTIRSMPGTDQSDVEFIRQALANQGLDQ